MHHIQKSIILTLARTSPLRFTELQPPRTANNTFSYHLKRLIENGYVELTKQGYVPTRKALKLVVFGVNTNKAPSTPQTITMVYVENEDGETLLLNRNRKPFQGWYGVPSGLIHRGENLDEAARRELYEKTGITAQDTKGALEAAGVLDFRYVDQSSQDDFLHIIAFVFTYKYAGDKQELSDKVTRYGQLTWSRLDRDNVLPEVYVLKKLVKAGVFTHASVNFEEPAQMPALTDVSTAAAAAPA